MKKKLALTVLGALLALTMAIAAGCGNGDAAGAEPEASASVSEMADALVEKIPVATMEPVSYTHLDVYKRQTFFRATPWALIPGGLPGSAAWT